MRRQAGQEEYPDPAVQEEYPDTAVQEEYPRFRWAEDGSATFLCQSHFENDSEAVQEVFNNAELYPLIEHINEA
ncbi:17252_t:CDS:2 [Funneliformis geosporum]|uniref:17252_t:CDS:1 n=1 Tax=Funneliformis geosporum TaxID=1117311 RepID=A0A9W4X1L8_9GLOM|nr:17252_t:CDS:2 [Funneliformis geosporum]